MLINDLLGSEKPHRDVPGTPAEHSTARHYLKSSNSEHKLGSHVPGSSLDMVMCEQDILKIPYFKIFFFKVEFSDFNNFLSSLKRSFLGKQTCAHLGRGYISPLLSEINNWKSGLQLKETWALIKI